MKYDKYADAIEKHYAELENKIMADIIRRIEKTGEITSTADWQVNKLIEYGYSSKDIETIIRNASVGKTIDELYEEVIDWEYVRNKELYENVNGNFIPYDDNYQLQTAIQSYKDQTNGTLENITNTMGFVDSVNGQLTFLPLTDFVRNTLTQATIEIMSGAFDYNSTLRKAVKTMSNSGVRTIDYASGRTSRITAATRRAVMTTLHQCVNNVSEYNADALRTEYYEVDWHESSRPEHAVWQGRVWSKEEMVTVCGEGTVTGFGGINCYHIKYPFIKGVSERSYTDEWLREQNRLESKPIEYGGKEYNAYEAKQRQRTLEVRMRAERQRIVMLKQGKADDLTILKSQKAYKDQIANYKAFCRATGRKTDFARVYMDGLGRVL